MLKAFVQNGYASYRPKLMTGKMERSDGQSWRQDLKEGSHRVCKSWYDERYSWLDGDGVPMKPDFGSLYPKAPAPGPELEPEHSAELKDDKFTQNHTRQVNGIDLEVDVVDLEVDGEFTMPADLKDLIMKDPKTRRQEQQVSKMMHTHADADRMERKSYSKSKLRLALQGFFQGDA